MSDSGFRPYRVIYTTQRYLREHPAEVRAFVAASLRGWDDFMNGDPSPGKALISKGNPTMSERIHGLLDQGDARRTHRLREGPRPASASGLMTRQQTAGAGRRPRPAKDHSAIDPAR